MKQREQGQALVQVALLLTVLLLFAALAVDVSHLYAERRRMQNAADAGALAGARALCFDEGDPAAQAQQYAALNGAEVAAVTVAGANVTVIASETTEMYFAGIIGLANVNVSAEAEAVCGKTERATGLWPVAFNLAAWNSIPCGHEFILWDDTSSATSDICTKCDCNGVAYNAPDIDPGDRGWLRFSPPPAPFPSACGDSCGASALGCWILNDYKGPIEIGDCVLGDPGVKVSALQDAVSRQGDTVRVLLWDNGSCSGSDVIGDCFGTLYHIADFGCARILEYDSKLTLDPLPGYKRDDCPKNEKVLRALKLCDCPATNYGRTEGTPIPSGGIGAASLIR